MKAEKKEFYPQIAPITQIFRTQKDFYTEMRQFFSGTDENWERQKVNL